MARHRIKPVLHAVPSSQKAAGQSKGNSLDSCHLSPNNENYDGEAQGKSIDILKRLH